MTTANGVLLKPIPQSPNGDYMAGEDGLIYSRKRGGWRALRSPTKKVYPQVTLMNKVEANETH
jgi:hypothetical protein